MKNISFIAMLIIAIVFACNKQEIMTPHSDSNNENLDYNSTIEVFKNVRKRVQSESSENEQFYLISAIEIGINSLTYWHDNISKWEELLGDNNNSIATKAKWFSWKTIGKEDVKGAIAGAVGVGQIIDHFWEK